MLKCYCNDFRCSNIIYIFGGFEMSYVISILWLLATCFFIGMCFVKMGMEQWRGFIPGYNFWILFREVEGNGHRVFLCLIPIYGLFWVLVPMCKKLAVRFGKSQGWGWGLALVSPVFFGLLGLNKSVSYDANAK